MKRQGTYNVTSVEELLSVEKLEWYITIYRSIKVCCVFDVFGQFKIQKLFHPPFTLRDRNFPTKDFHDPPLRCASLTEAEV